MVDELLTEVTLRSRPALFGGLEIELPNGKTVYISHAIGPHERQAIAQILGAVAQAHGRSNGATRPQG